MNWYLAALKNYADFEGRARRKEYWMFLLFNLIFAGVAFGIDSALGTPMVVYLLYSLATLIPGIAVAVRRLHDIGKSGWWILIALVPLVGGIWLIVLMATEGARGDNEYGADPKNEPALT